MDVSVRRKGKCYVTVLCHLYMCLNGDESRRIFQCDIERTVARLVVTGIDPITIRQSLNTELVTAAL